MTKLPHNNPWIEQANIDNLVPYTHPSAAWTDQQSIVNLCWLRENDIGLQQLQVLYGWQGEIITPNLLNWYVQTEAEQIIPTLKERIFRPDVVREVDAMDELTLECETFYPMRNAISCAFTMTNESEKAIKGTLFFDTPTREPDYDVMPSGELIAFETESQGSWMTLFSHHEHGRNFCWVKQHVAGMTEGTTVELVCLADTSPQDFWLEPGKSFQTTITLCFGLNLGRAKEVRSQCEHLSAINKLCPQEATKRHKEVLRNATDLPDATPLTQRMYTHAISGLKRLFIQGDGGYTGGKCVPYTTTYALAMPFYWDTAFSAMGTLEFDTTLCQDAISCFTENASPRGSMPGTLCDSHRAGEGQAPIMAWAAWEVFTRSGNKEWLASTYPALANYNRFWQKYHTSSQGLYQYYNAGQIADNDVRFDPIFEGKKANEPVYGIDYPDLNALFVINMRCLGNMATELGFSEEAATWKKRADALTQKIVDVFYFPDKNLFLDVKEDTREIVSGTVGPNMFFPLLLPDLPLSQKQVQTMIEQYLLNPDKFFDPRPFPSVAYDDPEYMPTGYWRGRVWPHIGFLMLQVLWQHGYQHESDKAANWFLELFQTTPWFHENYAGRTEGGNAPPCMPEYNWALATVIRLLLRRYRAPVITPKVDLK